MVTGKSYSHNFNLIFQTGSMSGETVWNSRNLWIPPEQQNSIYPFTVTKTTWFEDGLFGLHKERIHGERGWGSVWKGRKNDNSKGFLKCWTYSLDVRLWIGVGSVSLWKCSSWMLTTTTVLSETRIQKQTFVNFFFLISKSPNNHNKFFIHHLLRLQKCHVCIQKLTIADKSVAVTDKNTRLLFSFIWTYFFMPCQ